MGACQGQEDGGEVDKDRTHLEVERFQEEPKV